MIKVYFYYEGKWFSTASISTTCLSETTILNRVAKNIDLHLERFGPHIEYDILWSNEKIGAYYRNKINLLLKEKGITNEQG